MNRFISIVILLLHFSGILGQEITLELVTAGPLKSLPGKVLTVVLKATNHTGKRVEVQPGCRLPENWQAVAGFKSFSLDAGQSALQLLTFNIPTNEAPGIYNLQYIATFSENEVELGIPVEVETVLKIAVEPLEAPSFSTAGKEIKVKFLVQNLCNLPQSISIKTESGTLPGDNNFFLRSQESKVVEVSATSFPDIVTESQFPFRIEATLDSNPSISAHAVQFVRIVPRENMKVQEGQRLPVILQMFYLGRSPAEGTLETGLQGELHINGALDKERKQHVEVKLRGPGNYNVPVLGLYEEYFAHYRNRKIDLFAGDKTYRLSYLTEFSRYGRGLQASAYIDRLEVGAFFLKPLFYPEIEREIAFYAKLQYPGGSGLSLNLLRKTISENSRPSTLMSIAGDLQLPAQTVLEAEFSKGNMGEEFDGAMRLNLQSRPMTNLFVSGGFMYAGKDFPGYFNNTRSLSALVAYQLVKKLNVSFLANRDEANAALDTLFSIAPSYARKQASLIYEPWNFTQLNLSAHKLEVEDRLPNEKFHYREDFLKLQLTQTAGDFRFTADGEIGKRTDLLLPSESKVFQLGRAGINAQFQFSQRNSAGAFANYLTLQPTNGPKNEQWIFGVAINAQFRTRTRLNLSLQNNFTQEEYYRNRNLCQFNLRQSLGRFQELGLTGYYTLIKRTERNAEFSFAVNYGWQFGLRTDRRPQSQGLSGKISAAGLDSVKGIIVHLNGQTATTDEEGLFSFPFIPAGTYFLFINPSNLGLHIVPDIPTPISITITQGVDAHIEFSITKAVSIEGRIEVEEYRQEPGNLENKEGLGHVILEVSNGEEVFRRLTNEDYSFEFTDLRPGTWTLNVLKKNSNAEFDFNQERFEMNLAPGENRQLILKVTKKKRKIKFQENWNVKTIGN